MYMIIERHSEYWKVISLVTEPSENNMVVELTDIHTIEKIKYNLKNNIVVCLLDDYDEELEIFNLFYNKSELEMHQIVKIDEIKKTFESGVASNKLHGGSIEFTMIYYDIIMVLNKLANNGFYSGTDKNEMYLQILESNDADMIELLEKFLEHSDQLKKMSFVHKKTLDAIEKIKNCESIEEIDLFIGTFDKYKGVENYNMM